MREGGERAGSGSDKLEIAHWKFVVPDSGNGWVDKRVKARGIKIKSKVRIKRQIENEGRTTRTSTSAVQGEVEGCADAYFAFHPNLAAMGLDNVLDDGEA